MSFKINWKTHIICSFISGFIALVLLEIANGIIENFIMQDFIQFPTRLIIVNFYIGILMLLVLIIAVHEALHGLAYIMFGGKVTYGFKGIYAYAMEVSALPIQRTKFLVVLLMPVVQFHFCHCSFMVRWNDLFFKSDWVK